MGILRRGRPKPVYAPVIRTSKGEVLALWERYFERGLYAYSKGDFEDALADLDEAIENVNKNGEVYAVRGMILQQMGKYDLAEEDFDLALKIDPRQWVVYYLRAHRAYQQKKYDEAITLASEAARFAPLRPEILYLRAVAYYTRGETKRAFDELEIALTSAEDPENKDQRDLYRNVKKFHTQLKRELKDKK